MSMSDSLPLEWRLAAALLAAAQVAGCATSPISWPMGAKAKAKPAAALQPTHPPSPLRSGGRALVYQKALVHLTRAYDSYEDYAHDPNNIDPSEFARVERLMTAVALPRQYPSREQAVFEIEKLTFPGYGSGSLETVAKPGDPDLQALFAEIPQSGKTRYVVIAAEAKGPAYVVIDDFVALDVLHIRGVRRQGNVLIYTDPSGLVVFTRPVAP